MAPTRPARVLIADDSEHTSRALEHAIRDADDEFSVVGVAADAHEAVALAERTQPDVALVDVRMPGGGGPAATAGIRAVSPDTKVLAYSVADDRSSVVEMLQCGARGYLLKGGRLADVLESLRACASGATVLSADLSSLLVEELTEQAAWRERKERERWQQIQRIRRLLEPGGIVPVFQPIVRLGDEEIVGYEALSRFADGGRPAAVFAEADAAGLRADLEMHALRAQVDAFVGSDVDRGELGLAVNLSPDMVASLDALQLLEPSGGGRRVIEVTEVAGGETPRLSLAVALARSLGVMVAIDGTGAGYSSLKKIVEVSPDIVKLDRSLIGDLDTTPAKRHLVESLASYCAKMGWMTVGEGIETPEELAVLQDLGVTYGQGYYFGEPRALPLRGAA